jgi:hypothetical protein
MGDSDARKNSWFFELALVLVRFDHVARVIVNADDGIGAALIG